MDDRVLILKVVNEDMTSHCGFTWPESGPVSPVTWDSAAECGNGLHGWLAGEGDYRHSFMDGKWLVFSAKREDVVSLDGGEKVKAKEGNVVFCGTRVEAVAFLKENGALTSMSKPGWCCFSVAQLQELAYRSATRASKVHAVKALRASKRPGLIKHAELLEALADITDLTSAKTMRAAAYAAADAAYAANAAVAAAYAADAYAAANAAVAAAYAAAYAAANAAVAADAAREQEREAQRLDKLELLGFKVR